MNVAPIKKSCEKPKMHEAGNAGYGWEKKEGNSPFLGYARIWLFKKSKFEAGAEEVIQPEILVEFVVKPVETRYKPKSKKKAFRISKTVDRLFRSKINT